MPNAEDTPTRCPGAIACTMARETLAQNERELLGIVDSLEADVHAYRTLSLEAIAAVRDLTAERRHLCTRLHGLVAELRSLRDGSAA